jgi:diadenosine tetraphosphate (Ap4A) HIT family hydrolase
MNDSCPLCAANLSSAGELVADFGDWKLLLHPDSAVRGHAMLVAGRHIENFADLTDSEAQQLARVQKVVERALLDVTGADRAILMKLGIAVPHFHLHIYPVTRSMTRDDVMRVIDAKVSEERAPGFGKTVLERIHRLT